MNFILLHTPWIAAALSLILVLIAVLPLKRFAVPLGLVDHPCDRKQHEGIIPLVGGVAVFSVFIALSLLSGFSWGAYWPLYSALIVLLVTGAVDDHMHLMPFVKFGLQFVAALLVVLPGGAVLPDLGDLFGLGDFALGWMRIPFSVVAVVLLINAINLMDGLDGLSGGTGIIILGWMLFACWLAGDHVTTLSLSILMAGLAGFLFYNMRAPWRDHAVIFMGDAGSMALGLMVGWYAIRLSLDVPTGRVIEPIAVAWVLALPIWDECAQFYRRVKEGRHPFSPDRGHFHHHFIRAGFSPGQATLIIHGIILILGAIGVIGWMAGVPLPLLTLVWIIGILAHMAYSKNLERYSNLIAGLKNGGAPKHPAA